MQVVGFFGSLKPATTVEFATCWGAAPRALLANCIAERSNTCGVALAKELQVAWAQRLA